MENFNALTKMIVDTTKLVLIRLDEIKIKDLLIDYVEVQINQNDFNVIKSETSSFAITIQENENNKLLLLTKGIEVVKDQTIDKLMFTIVDNKDKEIKSLAFITESINSLNIELQKKGLPVTKIEKIDLGSTFSLKKEVVNIIFNSNPLAMRGEIIALKSRLQLENEAKLRIMADYQNYKKRQAQIQKETTDMANRILIDQVIEVIDDCNRALNNENHDGVNLLLEKLYSLLSNQGLELISIKSGDNFNPMFMEAISSIPVSEHQLSNTVVHVDQQGYKYKTTQKTYRPAKVIVSK